MHDDLTPILILHAFQHLTPAERRVFAAVALPMVLYALAVIAAAVGSVATWR